MVFSMSDHNIGRLMVLASSVVMFIIIIIFNVLAGPGAGPFLNSTNAVSAKYDTEITPSGWTFSIWGIIYCWVMIPALIFLALIAFTNYVMIFFSCVALKHYGTWLNKHHKANLWCIRILVQNGLAVYTTWTTIATLINFTIVLNYDAGVMEADAATISLSVLLGEVVAWFIVENFVLEKHLRYILTIYPVLIMALSGNITKNFDSSGPSRNAVFTAALLGMASVLLVVRIILVVWRHWKRPLYTDAEVLPQMEIAENLKNIFK